MDATSDPQAVFGALLQAYGEPQRAYHTLEHIRDCLIHFDEAFTLAEHPIEVETALWLHDVVYDPRGTDNEERSADWAENVLREGGIPAPIIARICELILATKHKTLPSDGDTALLVDIDLSILGRDAATFERYERQIRREYDWVPGAVYRQRRAALLESFLSRAFIYQTPAFRQRYESQARENLLRSVARLRGGT